MEPNNEIPRAEQIGKKVEIKIPEKPRLENPPQEKRALSKTTDITPLMTLGKKR